MNKTANENEIIKISEVYKSYIAGKVETSVLRGINLAIERGTFVVVFGASGSGKTTLLNLLGALDAPDRGSILVDGVALEKLDNSGRSAYRRDKLGFIFQFYNLLPTLTAAENVEAALEILPLSRKAISARSQKYLSLVGLSGKERQYPSELSGGEQQRVAVARALAREPSLILADEPTGNLDAATGAQVTDLMLKLQKELNLSIIVVTHNDKLAASADRIIRIEGGQIVE